MNSTDKPIRVLHVIGSMRQGGAETWLMDILRNSDKSKIQMDFCELKEGNSFFTSEIMKSGSSVFKIPVKNIKIFKRNFINLLKKQNYNIVHSHVWSFSGQILKYASLAKVPVRISHSHNTKGKHKDSIYRKIYSYWMRHLIFKYSTACVACGKLAAESLYGQSWEKRQKVCIIYCSINTEQISQAYDSDYQYKMTNIPQNAIVIGHAGKMSNQKNHSFLLDIAKETINRNENVYFFLAGDGELKESLYEKACKLGINDKIIMPGMRDDIPKLLVNIFDAFLFPSLFEGMPLSLVEAATAGLQIVYSDTITDEAEVIPELFTKISLDKPAFFWAEELLKVVEKKKMPLQEAYNITSKSSFTNNKSLDNLIKLYNSQIRKFD